MKKTDFSPLSWSILFFSMWFTLKSIDTGDNTIFRWILFGMSIVLLVSIYWDWLYNVFNQQKSVQWILPTIFFLTVASFIISVLFALKDLNTAEQYIALTVSFIFLGIYIAVLISTLKKLGYRIAGCGLILLIFIIRLISNGLEGSWPLIVILVQSVWGMAQPDKFNKIPLV